MFTPVRWSMKAFEVRNGEDMENALKINDYGKTLSFCEIFFIKEVWGGSGACLFILNLNLCMLPMTF